MTFEVKDSIRLKKDGVKYNLMPGDIVAGDIFDPRDRKRFLDLGCIEKSKKKVSKIKGVVTPALVDLSTLSVAEIKEVLELEYNGANLERYLDQENNQDAPRKSVVRYLNNRITELTA